MAVRPWENRFLDINLKDGVMVHENGLPEGKKGTKAQNKPPGKISVSNLHSNVQTQKSGQSHSEGSGSSSGQSVNQLASSAMPSVKGKSKPSFEEVPGEAISRPSGVGTRSYSNPKERPSQLDSQAKKRLSLPSSGESTSYSKNSFLNLRQAIASFVAKQFAGFYLTVIGCHLVTNALWLAP